MNLKQQDAHEFFQFFIQELKNSKHSDLWFCHAFDSVLLSKVHCERCLNTTGRPYDTKEFIVNVDGKKSITEAIAVNFERSVIDDYRCEKCEHFGSAIKTDVFVVLPVCLVLILQKFQKTTNAIEICTKLDLLGREYNLVGLINHIKIGRSSGHYTAIVWNGEGKFSEFDDSKRNCLDTIVGSNARILFYELNEVILIILFWQFPFFVR